MGAMPDAQEGFIREKVAKAQFDLARLMVATRLMQLRGEPSTGSLSAFVPNYLPKAPLDPFSEKPYLWQPSEGCFYSVGPDRTDNRLEKRYDPTNGTLSSGDIGLIR
jgi:hypothetical protein